jgi:hypothetical protein
MSEASPVHLPGRAGGRMVSQGTYPAAIAPD